MKNTGNILVNLISIIVLVVVVGGVAIIFYIRHENAEQEITDARYYRERCAEILATPTPTFSCEQWMAEHPNRTYADGSTDASALEPSAMRVDTCAKASLEVESKARRLEEDKQDCR